MQCQVLTYLSSMKKFIFAFIFLLILAVGTVLGLNYFFRNKIVYFLNNALADNISLQYEDVSVDSWEGTVTLSNSFLSIQKRGDTLVNTKISTSEVTISSVSYWDYFVHNTVHVEEIKIDDNNIWYLDERGTKKKPNSGPIRLGKEIEVDHLTIGNTFLEILKPEQDSLFMSIERGSFNLDNIRITKELITRKIPLEYSAMYLEADTVFLKIDPFINLTIEEVRLDQKNIKTRNARIKTKYGRQELSTKIDVERDFVDLNIPEFTINGISWGFDEGALFTFAEIMKIEKPSLEIYRDKFVADDDSNKALYSKMVRSIPFDLMLDSLVIDQASIVYKEKVKKDQPAGKLDFTDLIVQAERIGNTYKKGEDTTKLSIRGTFMNTAPLNINWSFDVQDTTDRFALTGYLGSLPAERINRFTEPNLRVKMKGNLERVYFNINGNDDKSTVDMRMAYDDFKVDILNKKSESKKFLSAIANLFVSSDSKDSDKDGFRNGRGEATRDKTKSFFNYLWLNLKDGLVEVLLGDGRYD